MPTTHSNAYQHLPFTLEYLIPHILHHASCPAFHTSCSHTAFFPCILYSRSENERCRSREIDVETSTRPKVRLLDILLILVILNHNFSIPIPTLPTGVLTHHQQRRLILTNPHAFSIQGSNCTNSSRILSNHQ
jgi:hypothetical protein